MQELINTFRKHYFFDGRKAAKELLNRVSVILNGRSLDIYEVLNDTQDIVSVLTKEGSDSFEFPENMLDLSGSHFMNKTQERMLQIWFQKKQSHSGYSLSGPRLAWAYVLDQNTSLIFFERIYVITDECQKKIVKGEYLPVRIDNTNIGWICKELISFFW